MNPLGEPEKGECHFEMSFPAYERQGLISFLAIAKSESSQKYYSEYQIEKR